jgi:hypothetical protein
MIKLLTLHWPPEIHGLEHSNYRLCRSKHVTLKFCDETKSCLPYHYRSFKICQQAEKVVFRCILTSFVQSLDNRQKRQTPSSSYSKENANIIPEDTQVTYEDCFEGSMLEHAKKENGLDVCLNELIHRFISFSYSIGTESFDSCSTLLKAPAFNLMRDLHKNSCFLLFVRCCKR